MGSIMNFPTNITSASLLPDDGTTGTLIGRVWLPASMTGTVAGPAPVLLNGKEMLDLSSVGATVSELINQNLSRSSVQDSKLHSVGSIEDILSNSLAETPDPDKPVLLAPVDIQSIKACGVTFICSMLERVIEEQAGGDSGKASQVRERVNQQITVDLDQIVPGSREAEDLKAVLQAEGVWSQYLEVGIGPYAEVFTKSQPLSAVGPGSQIGIHPASNWNNPEPEVVLAVDDRGQVRGATLGNDVNLRDIEGRSALLLGKAKDNNASCAIGPFIRLFDDSFGIDDVRQAEVTLTVMGEDGFRLKEASPMIMISRDVLDLVSQTINENHQYPDGLAIFTGTPFSPTQDRDEPGSGFTHKQNDIVMISSPKLGSLVNSVTRTDKAPPWEFGITALMKNLAQRDLLR